MPFAELTRAAAREYSFPIIFPVATAGAKATNYHRTLVAVNTGRMNKLRSIIVYTRNICRANKACDVSSCILHDRRKIHKCETGVKYVGCLLRRYPRVSLLFRTKIRFQLPPRHARKRDAVSSLARCERSLTKENASREREKGKGGRRKD